MFNRLTYNLKLFSFNRRWKSLNKNNDTWAESLFPERVVTVGEYSYGGLNVITSNDKSSLHIGRFVSIAQNVTFLLDVEHRTDTVSTFPFRTRILMGAEEAFSKGDIIVDNDVWIGHGATVISGVHIGQGAVVAAGALVTKDVEPYSIVGGVPAKLIRYRFEKSVIDYLMTLDYDLLSKEQIETHIDELYTSVNDPDKMKIMLEWFPKKTL